jgi:hypothetical protein
MKFYKYTISRSGGAGGVASAVDEAARGRVQL